MENYFWAVSVFFEPNYSLGRIIYTKMIEILAITDDTYDAYGTFDELGLYTNAVQGYELFILIETSVAGYNNILHLQQTARVIYLFCNS